METRNNLRVAEVRVSYSTKIKAGDRPQVSNSSQIHSVIQCNWNYEIIEFIEEFKIILLNRANRVLGIVPISVGGTAGTIVDPKVVFVAALKANAHQIILVHNHPSGNLKPSEADRQLTSKLKEAGRYLDLQVIDHLILTKDGYLSFADEGII